MPVIAPNKTAAHGPKSGPAETTAAIARVGINDSFSGDSSSAEDEFRTGRLIKVCTRKMPMNVAPTSPELLMIAANQLDVRVEPI